MSDTILDYDKLNKHLPQSLRNFCGSVDRIYTQDFKHFIAMYKGLEQMAVFNNRIAAEFASGFTELNYMYLRSPEYHLSHLKTFYLVNQNVQLTIYNHLILQKGHHLKMGLCN